jgi:hypothetical protein
LCSSAGCLLYTDSFNVAPDVQLIAPDKMLIGRREMFTARATDRDQRSDTLRYSWFQLQVANIEGCPKDAAEAQSQLTSAMQLDTRSTQAVTLTEFASYCVWVVVTDRAGASGFAGKGFKVENQPPTADLKLVSPQPLRWVGPAAHMALYSNVRISATTSSDPEEQPLEFRWRITGRNGETIAPLPCDGLTKPAQVCHRLEASGEYRFELRTWDGAFESPPTELPILVMPDAPPCIEQTEPSYELPQVVVFSTERTNIQVLAVTDDGDPFPAAPGQQPQLAFIWRHRLVGAPEFQRQFLTTMPTLSFPPDNFRPGDEIEVRLDIFDRVADRDFRACEGQPECKIDPERDCRQRVSWRVSYR